MSESTVCLFMSFGDECTHEYRVKEGTVPTALWFNVDGNTGESFSAEMGADPFPFLQGRKPWSDSLLWWTDRKEAQRRTSLKESKDQWTDGSCSHCGAHVYFRFHIFNCILVFFHFVPPDFFALAKDPSSCLLDIEICSCFPSAEKHNCLFS